MRLVFASGCAGACSPGLYTSGGESVRYQREASIDVVPKRQSAVAAMPMIDGAVVDPVGVARPKISPLKLMNPVARVAKLSGTPVVCRAAVMTAAALKGSGAGSSTVRDIVGDAVGGSVRDGVGGGDTVMLIDAVFRWSCASATLVATSINNRVRRMKRFA